MNKLLKAFLAGLVFAWCNSAGADLWGFVDENGVAHVSTFRVDERYYLFKKDPPAPAKQEEIAADSPLLTTPRAAVSVNPAYRKQYAPLVTVVAKEQGIDAALLHAVITVESGYNPKAQSPKGAMGLMQLMPDTASRYAVKNVWDPRENLRGGAQYLRDLLGMFNNNLRLALAAYNAGAAAVIQAGNQIPPFAETRSYVPAVLAHYDRYRSIKRR